MSDDLERVIGRLEATAEALGDAVKANAELTTEVAKRSSAQIERVSDQVGRFVASTQERFAVGERIMTSLQNEQSQIKTNQRWGFGLTALAIVSVALFVITNDPIATLTGLGMTTIGGIFKLVGR